MRYENIIEKNLSHIDLHEELENIRFDIQEVRPSEENLHIDTQYCEIIIEKGYRLLNIYYQKYKDVLPSDLDYFEVEHENIINLIPLIVRTQHILKNREHEDFNEENVDNVDMLIRRWQVHPVNQLRGVKGYYNTIVPELKKYPEKFRHYIRMSEKHFDVLVEMLTPMLSTSEKYRSINYSTTFNSFSNFKIFGFRTELRIHRLGIFNWAIHGSKNYSKHM